MNAAIVRRRRRLLMASPPLCGDAHDSSALAANSTTIDHSVSAQVQCSIIAWARKWDAVGGCVVSYRTGGLVVSLSP